jgi:hypothetical protein
VEDLLVAAIDDEVAPLGILEEDDGGAVPENAAESLLALAQRLLGTLPTDNLANQPCRNFQTILGDINDERRSGFIRSGLLDKLVRFDAVSVSDFLKLLESGWRIAVPKVDRPNDVAPSPDGNGIEADAAPTFDINRTTRFNGEL